jgi:hypothetical protein
MEDFRPCSFARVGPFFSNYSVGVPESRMTIFYFDIQINVSPVSVDEDGVSLQNIDEARIEAGRILCEVARDLLQEGIMSSLLVVVRDEAGEVLRATLDFQMQRLN